MSLNQWELIGWLCMRMAITEEHLTMQYISIALEVNIFEKKLENSYETKI